MNAFLKILLPVVALVSFGAIADDHQAAGTETSHDVSTNPVTGTVTEKTTTESDTPVGNKHKKTKKVVKKKHSKDGHKKSVDSEETSKTE